MSSLLKITRETRLAGAIGGILSRPAAAVAMAAGLSVLTLAASLYLFMFAGRDLLPPPPIAGLPATPSLEPVPMNYFSLAVPEPGTPPAAAVVEFLASAIPAAEAVVAQGDDGAAGIVAGASVAPFREEDDDDDGKDGRKDSKDDKPEKRDKDKSGSGESIVSRHED